MKKVIIALGVALGASLGASADIVLKFPAKPSADKLLVQHMLIADVVANGAKPATDTISITSKEVTVPLDKNGDARYRISFAGAQRGDGIDLFASPGDNIIAEVVTEQPLAANVSGTELLEDMAAINASLRPIEEQVRKIQQGELPETLFPQLAKDYDRILSEFVDANPKSPAVIYAVLSMDEPFDKYVGNLDASLADTPLFPLLAPEIEKRAKAHELEQRKEQLSSGQVMAPDFTLKNLEGKDVSLSQFRGKWVILDFWGSWCMWCIKGFPGLKDAYQQYAGKLEIIGVDCGDTDKAWRDAVAKYKLPWVNVYNPQGPGNLTEVYPVQGFPTKVIINPEGKIQKIVTGEDPGFYTLLKSLIEG